MGIAIDMQKLCEDIATSYDLRVKAVGTLVHDVHRTLKNFTAERKKMADEQARRLANFVKDLTKNVDKLIKDFQKKHKEMSEEQARALKDFLAELSKNVGKMIKDFQKEHTATADDLRKSLDKYKNDIETYVKNKLKEFSEAHADMSAELKKDLAKYVGGIVKETEKLLSGFEKEKIAASWQALAATMAKKRGTKSKFEAEVKVKPVKEAVKDIKKKSTRYKEEDNGGD